MTARYVHLSITGKQFQQVKGKGFPYSTPSVGPGADPGVQAVSPPVTVSHPPGSRLPLLSARPPVTSPASEHHCPLAGTKLYCLVTEAYRCEQLAQGCYAASPRAGFELATCWSQAQTPYPLHHRATLQQIDHATSTKLTFQLYGSSAFGPKQRGPVIRVTMNSYVTYSRCKLTHMVDICTLSKSTLKFCVSTCKIKGKH